MSLIDAQIMPSEEDSQTFVVISACSEIYKLKAKDAKERQFWVNMLRLTIQNWEDHINKSNESSGLLNSGNQSQHHSKSQIMPNSPFDTNLLQSLDSVSKQMLLVSAYPIVSIILFLNALQFFFQTEKSHLNLVESINELKSTDMNILQIKANS